MSLQELCYAIMENMISDTKKLLKPAVHAYEHRLKRFGPTARGVFWKNQEWQHRRYVILEKIFNDLDQKGGVSIHDFGCGYGYFLDYLMGRPVMCGSRYIGTDMSEGMINAANKRHVPACAQFVCGTSAQEITDYTIISGTYNMHINANIEEWACYVKASLKQLWQHTRYGLAFNMLRNDTEIKYDGLFYADPTGFLNFARKKLSPESTLRFDWPLPDFTVFVRRPEVK